jgi:hypothetical protein
LQSNSIFSPILNWILSAGKLIESSSDLGIVVKSIGAVVTISSVVTSAGNVLSLSSIELVGNVVSCGAIVSKYSNKL